MAGQVQTITTKELFGQQAPVGTGATVSSAELFGDAASAPAEDAGFFENAAYGMGEGALHLGGSFFDLIDRTIDPVADALESAVPLGRFTFDGEGNVGWRATTDDDAAQPGGLTDVTSRMRGADFGYNEQTSWEDVKDDPISNVLPYAFEQGLVSTPDMIAAIVNLPGYVIARTGELGYDRAQNKGLDEPTMQEFAESLPPAVGSALLERFGAKGMFGLSDDVSRAVDIPGAALKAGGKEAATEAGQEAIEYTGTTVGTNELFNLAEMGDRMAAGAVAGGPFGAGVRTVTGTAEAAFGGDRSAPAVTEDDDPPETGGGKEAQGTVAAPAPTQSSQGETLTTEEVLGPQAPSVSPVSTGQTERLVQYDPDTGQEVEGTYNYATGEFVPDLPEPAEDIGTRTSPAPAEAIDRAAENVAQPTPAQAEAGNYSKGHIKVQGMDIAIETAQGGERSGTGPDGKPWSVTMPAHYGYVKRTEGADGDQVDVYIGPQPESDQVFVVDQIDADSRDFDEHKAMIGFPSGYSAQAAYKQAFNDGRGSDRMGAVTAMSVPQFRAWLKDGDTKKPLAYQKPAQQPALPVPQVVESLRARIRNRNQSLHPDVLVREMGLDRPTVVRALQHLAGRGDGIRMDAQGRFRRLPDLGPLDAKQLIAAAGGIRDDEGHALAKSRDMQRFVPQFGPLIRPTGKSVDEVGELLWERGYFGPAEATSRPSTDRVLELLEDVIQRDRKVYSEDDRSEIERRDVERQSRERAEQEADYRDQADASIRQAASLAGTNMTDEEVAQAVDIVMEGESIEDAIVDVVTRSVYNVAPYQETTDADDIPFPDVAPRAPEARSEPSGAGAIAPAGTGAGGNPGRGQPPQPGQAETSEDLNQAPAQSGASDSGALPTEGPIETTLGTAEQTVIPGAERSARQAAQARDGRQKSDKPQKTMDEGLFGTSDTTGDLFDAKESRFGGEAHRSHGIPEAADPPISSFDSAEDIKAHTDYAAAKSGDTESAIRLVMDMVKPTTVAMARRRFGTDAVYVAPHAEEAKGRNKIPRALAEYYSEATGASVNTDIVQTNKAHHTGAKPLERILARPTFEGRVEPGARYVLVDDVSVMGGTLAELANYIQANGGQVVGVVTLANASRSGIYKPTKRQISLIERRFGDELRSEIGVDPSALTADEAAYLANFRDLDTLRDRIASTRRKRSERSRPKGIPAPSSEKGLESRNSGKSLGRAIDDFSRLADKMAAVEAEVQRIAARIAPKTDVQVVGNIVSADGRRFGGQYTPSENLIHVALTIGDPRQTVRHETIHALRATGMFTDAEWSALVKRARQNKDMMARVREAYPDLNREAQIEEAIAEDFAEWATDQSARPRGIRRIYQRIADFFQRLKDWITRNDTKYRDVFEAIERGDVGKRKATKTPNGETKESRRSKFDWSPGGGSKETKIGDTTITYGVSRDGETAEIVLVRTPKAARNKGAARSAIERFLAEADAQGKTVFLTPEAMDKGVSKARLRDFYKSLGFLDNAGRRKDFRSRAAMVRDTPRPNAKESRFDGTRPSQSAYNVLSDENRAMLRRFKEQGVEALDRFRYVVQDKFIDLKRVQEAVEKARGGVAIPDEQNAYQAEVVYHGRTGERVRRFQEETVEPLIQKIADKGLSLDDVESYLYARHAPERNARIKKINPDIGDAGSGMSDAEAQATIDRLTSAGKIADLKEVARDIDHILKDTMRKRVEYGLLSQEEADRWQSAYEHYIPLRGFAELIDEDADSTMPRIGRGFDTRGKESKEALGRTTKAADLLSNVLTAHEEAIIRGEKNRVGQTFLNFVEANPDKALWEVDAVKTVRRLNKKTGMVESSRTANTIGENVLAVKRDGKVYHIAIHNRPLAQAMRNVGADTGNAVLRVMQKVNRALAFVNTSANPEFVISNMARDLQTAGINLQQFDHKGLTKDVMKGLPKALAGARSVIRGDGKHPNAQWYREFSEEGGKTEFFGLKSVEDKRKKIQAMLDGIDPSAPQKAKRAYLAAKKLVDDYNAIVENGIRLSTYAEMRKRGVPKVKAASIAKNLTVNFNRRGSLGPTFGAMYLFFNASIQGSVIMLQALKHRKVQKAVAGIVLFHAVLEVINGMLSPEDEDGERAYDKIPDYVRTHNMVFVNPFADDVEDPMDAVSFKIPLPYGYNVFANLGKAFGRGIRAGLGTGPSEYSALADAGELAGLAVESFNPLGGEVDIIRTLVPTLAKPIYEIQSNENFAGNPIMPEQSPYGAPTPDHERHFRSVSWLSKTFAEGLFDLTADSQLDEFAVDVSPETLDHLYEFWTGAAGAFLTRTGSLALDLVQGKTDDIRWNDVPFVRKVVEGRNEYWRQSRYFQIREAGQIAKAELKGLTGSERADYLREYRPEIMAAQLTDAADKRLKELRRTRNAIRDNESLSDDVREKRLERIEAQISAIYIRVLSRYSRAVEAQN